MTSGGADSRTGTSHEFGVDAWVEDLELVVDSAGAGPLPFVGLSQGGAVAMAYAVRHPDRVSRLVLVGAYARGRLERAASEEEREEAELDLQRRAGGLAPGRRAVPTGVRLAVPAGRAAETGTRSTPCNERPPRRRTWCGSWKRSRSSTCRRSRPGGVPDADVHARGDRRVPGVAGPRTRRADTGQHLCLVGQREPHPDGARTGVGGVQPGA